MAKLAAPAASAAQVVQQPSTALLAQPQRVAQVALVAIPTAALPDRAAR